jgi:hypothetical protein
MRRFYVPAWAGVAFFLLTTILLSACGPGGHPPACLPEAMSIPVIDEPGGWPYTGPYTVAEPLESNPPVFTWLDSGSCLPEEYRVIVSRIPFMPYGNFEYLEAVVWDVRVPFSPVGPVIVYPDGSTTNPSSWTPSAAFAPGVYYWRVMSYSGSVHGEPTEWVPFRIGPYCRPIEEYRLTPQLVYPRNGQLVTAYPTIFLWFDDNPCLLYGDYLLNVSTSPDFPPGDTIVSHGTPWTHYSLYLDACARYYWKVQVNFGEGIPAPVTEVRYFDTIYTDGTACTPATLIPVSTDTSHPLAVVLESANCRSGPTTEYPVLDILVEGAQLPIQGRNQAGDSWLVEDANINHTCWVHGTMVEVIGDTSLVNIIDPEPPTTPVPEPSDTAPFNCAQFNANTCTVNNHPCLWTAGGCVNK